MHNLFCFADPFRRRTAGKTIPEFHNDFKTLDFLPYVSDVKTLFLLQFWDELINKFRYEPTETTQLDHPIFKTSSTRTNWLTWLRKTKFWLLEIKVQQSKKNITHQPYKRTVIKFSVELFLNFVEFNSEIFHNVGNQHWKVIFWRVWVFNNLCSLRKNCWVLVSKIIKSKTCLFNNFPGDLQSIILFNMNYFGQNANSHKIKF